MKTIHVAAATTPEGAGQFRPKFGVDFPAYGAKDSDKKTMPSAVPGTFLDLFSPKIPGKGRVRASHTFKALTQVLCRALYRDIFGALMPEDKSQEFDILKLMTDSDLTATYNNLIPNLGKFVKVKREQIGWEIQVPVYATDLQSMLFKCVAVKKEYAVDGTLTEAGRRALGQIATYVVPTLAQIGWKFDRANINFAINTNRVAKTFAGEFLNVNSFYTNYVKEFTFQSYKNTAVTNILNDLDIESLKDIDHSDDATLSAFIFNSITSMLVVRATLFLPDKEVSYYVQSHAKDVKPYQVLDFFYRWYKYAFTSKLDLPTFGHPLVTTEAKNKGFTPKPRTNSLGLVLTNKNYLLFVPEHEQVNKLSAYADAYAKFSHMEDGYSTIASKPSDDLKQQVQFQLLYVDWVNNKILYTGETPNVLTIDLDTCYKCSNYTIASFLYSEVTGSGKNGFADYVLNLTQRNEIAFGDRGVVGDYLKGIDISQIQIGLMSINEIAGRNFARKFSLDMPLYAYINAVIDFLHDIHIGENKHHSKNIPKEYAYPVRAMDCTINASNPLLRPIGLWVKETHEKIMRDPFAYINKCQRSPYTTLQSIANLIVWNEAKNFDAYLQADKVDREVYITQDDLDPNYVPAFPNSDGVKSLMPHQAKVQNATRKIAPNVIVAVAAGGGKTIITITDILRSLVTDWKALKGKAPINKCLVICPSYLIKDYVIEINYVSKGTVNPVVFDTRVFANYSGTEDTQYTGRRDYSKLKALVDNAPPNTIFITGYDTYSRSGNEINVYGGELIVSNSHIEFMRSCSFDAVWMDESHFLKAADSGRAKAIELLISDIPYKRLLTGTIVPNSLVDLVRQVGFFNPGILGNEEDFRKQYSENGESTGAFVARQGAELEIFRQLKNHVVFQNVQRKEWAALLPKLREEFVPAYLTDNQRKVYDILLGELLDEMSGDKEAKDALQGSGNPDINGENDEDIEHVFEKYERNLSAIESFLASPMSMPMSADILVTDADKESPKGVQVVKILRKHLSNPDKYPGKIIIFCNTYASVEGIYKDLPSDIQAVTILYSAETKTENEAEFKTNPKKRIIIGISQSMETGLNLQIADTLIRIDNVWSPGRFEQGLARVNRPDLKSGTDPRMATGLFMYYITVDRTIDVLKTARLTSKTVQVARFYNAGTPDYKYYENIGIDPETGAPIEPITISLENLRTGLSWDDLEKYVSAYGEYRRAEDQVFEEFRRRNPTLTPVAVKHTGIMKGSAILKRIPYTPGMQIFGAKDLGLVPLPEYKRNFIEQKGEAAWDPKNLPVHTEYGDGLINSEAKSGNVNLSLYEGGSTSLRPSVVFVITKKVTSTEEIRVKLANLVKLDTVDIKLDSYRISNKKSMLAQKELEKKLKESKRQIEKEKQQQKINPNSVVRKNSRSLEEDDPIAPADDQTNKTINLYLTLTNELISLAASEDDPDVNIRDFKDYGFQEIPPYWYLEVKTAKILDELISKMDKMNTEEKIVLQDKYFYMLEEIEKEFKQGRAKLLQTTQKTKTDIGHFLIDKRRKISNPLEVRPVPLIVDGVLYICVDARTHNASAISTLKRIKIPGAMWELQDNTLSAFFTRKSDVLSTIKQIKADGYTIENEQELKETYNNMKVRGK